MKRIFLKLTFAATALGLWAATPASGQTLQQQQMYIRARQQGMWNRIRIYSQPQFQLVTDPRGANFGFSQQILWGPSLRSAFSPWGQTTVFRSNASSQLVWTPSMGTIARINTPAIFGFTSNASGATRSFSFPSISVLSNVNGSTRFLNPSTPTFLSGNFNLSVPVNGMAAIPMSSSTISASLSSAAAQSAANTTNAAAATMNTALSSRAVGNSNSAASASAAQTAATTNPPPAGFWRGPGGTLYPNWWVIPERTAAARQAAATTNPPPAGFWRGPGGTLYPNGWMIPESSRSRAQQAAAYNGYVPANQIIP